MARILHFWKASMVNFHCGFPKENPFTFPPSPPLPSPQPHLSLELSITFFLEFPPHQTHFPVHACEISPSLSYFWDRIGSDFSPATLYVLISLCCGIWLTFKFAFGVAQTLRICNWQLSCCWVRVPLISTRISQGAPRIEWKLCAYDTQ